jgi:hypothetical protein
MSIIWPNIFQLSLIILDLVKPPLNMTLQTALRHIHQQAVSEKTARAYGLSAILPASESLVQRFSLAA